MKASEYGGTLPLSVGKWFWNKYEDDVWHHGPFDTRAEAEAEARGYLDDDATHFYVGVGAELDVREPSADRVCEDMGEAAYEAAGDAAEGFPGADAEAECDLDAVLSKAVGEWLTRYDLWPGFCGIEGIERVEIAATADGPPAFTAEQTDAFLDEMDAREAAGADSASGEWGHLVAEPCRFCRQPGGVHFCRDEGPEGRDGQQPMRCDRCGRSWVADSATA